MAASFYRTEIRLKGNQRSLGSQRLLLEANADDPTLPNVRWQERQAPGPNGWVDYEVMNPVPAAGSGGGNGGGGDGGLADGDYGDILVSNSGTEMRIETGAVSLEKMQARSEATFIGREQGAGAGSPQEISPDEARAILNIADGATANSPDATLLARSNHTGTQPVATVTSLQAELDAKAAAVHVHSQSDVLNLTSDLAGKAPAIHSHDASAIVSGVIDQARLPAYQPLTNTVPAGGTIASLTAGEQAQITQGSFVTEADGEIYVYEGVGPKTDPASYILTGLTSLPWTSITGKPSTFTPTAHTHPQSEVTGLVTDLAAKQAADPTLTSLAGLSSSPGLLEQTGADLFAKRGIGVAAATDIPTRADADARYATAAHSHAYSSLTGLPVLGTASPLNVAATGNAATGEVVKGNDTRLTDARTPLAHTHAQGEITGLTTALAGKQAADPTLTELANLDSTTGVLEQTAADTFAKRALGVAANTSILTRGDGDGRFAPLNHTHLAAAVTDFAEAVDDRVATLLQPGTNVSFVYDDLAGTLTISAAGGAGGVADGNKGDVTVASSGTVWTINADAVGLAELDAAAEASLRDRSTHTGTQAQSTVTSLTTDLAAKAPLASPALTGTPTAPTATTGTSTTQLATTAFTAAALAAHAAAADPHTGYQLESEKAVANGYASLGATGLVPAEQLGSGTANATRFLRGDGAWQVPTATLADGDYGAVSISAGIWSLDPDTVGLSQLDAAAEASLRDRATHTGSQAASTISDFSSAADARIAAASINALADVVITAPANAQVLQYNGTSWINAAASGGEVVVADTAAEIVTGVASGQRVLVKAGTYTMSAQLTMHPQASLEANGGPVVLDFSGVASFADAACVYGTGTDAALPAFSGTQARWAESLTFASAHGLAVGDLLQICVNSNNSYSSARTNYHRGEFCIVRKVTSSTVVALEKPLYDSYTAAEATSFKLTPAENRISGITVTGNPAVLASGIRLVRQRRPRLRDVYVTRAGLAGVFIELAVNAELYGCEVHKPDDDAGSGNSYGLELGGCQHTKIFGGYYEGDRHGIAVGGLSGSLTSREMVTRDTRVIGATCTSNLQYSFNLHGNSELTVVDNCDLLTGFSFAGDDHVIQNSRVWPSKAAAQNGYIHQAAECKGCNFRYRNNTFYLTGAVNASDFLVDLASGAFGSVNTRGGQIEITDNTFDVTAFPAGERLVRVDGSSLSAGVKVRVIIARNIVRGAADPSWNPDISYYVLADAGQKFEEVRITDQEIPGGLVVSFAEKAEVARLNYSRRSDWLYSLDNIDELIYEQAGLPWADVIKSALTYFYERSAGGNRRSWGTAAPAAGTWDVGDDWVRRPMLAGSDQGGYIAAGGGGTYGTLTSCTGTITSGQVALTLAGANKDLVKPGHFIAIAGVAGTKRVVERYGDVATLDVAAGTSASGAAVTWVPPAWTPVPLLSAGVTLPASKLTDQTAKTGPYTLAAGDSGTRIPCTGSWTLTVPSAATLGNGFGAEIANTGAGSITVDGPGGTNLTLAANDIGLILVSGGVVLGAKNAFTAL